MKEHCVGGCDGCGGGDYACLRDEIERLKHELDKALMTVGKIALGDPETLKVVAEMRKAAMETGFINLGRR